MKLGWHECFPHEIIGCGWNSWMAKVRLPEDTRGRYRKYEDIARQSTWIP